VAILQRNCGLRLVPKLILFHHLNMTRVHPSGTKAIFIPQGEAFIFNKSALLEAVFKTIASIGQSFHANKIANFATN
jgi:hypothetical protein